MGKKTQNIRVEETPKPRVPSAAEIAARSRVLKGSSKMAEQYGIEDDFVRETVKVASLPDPPATEIVVQATAKRNAPAPRMAPEQMVLQILQDEAEEIAVRLERLGIAFHDNMKQDMIDHCFSLIALSMQGVSVGGGAIARR